MRWFIVFPLTALVLAAADGSSAPKQTKPAPPATAAKPQSIPAGAVEIEPGTFRFTDKEGKTWIYRKSPFGMMRFASKAGDQATPGAAESKTADPAPPEGAESKTAEPAPAERTESKPAEPAVSSRDLKEIKATEDGDTIRFERPSPFGVMRWQKKKSELNEMERAVWEREAARRSAGQE